MLTLTAIVQIWLVSALLAAVVAGSKGRSSVGWLLIGLPFGPLALLATIGLPTDGRRAERAGLQSGKLRKCPECAETILREAKKCKHCGSDVAPLERPRGIFDNIGRL